MRGAVARFGYACWLLCALWTTSGHGQIDASTRIAFVSDRLAGGGAYQSHIFIMNADGSGVRKLTPVFGDGEYVESSPTWSPDGKRIAFDAGTLLDDDIYVINADGTNVQRLTRSPGADRLPAWSPDGREIAFSSGEPGRIELFAIQPDGRNLRQVTDERGVAYTPTWSPSSREIAYVSAPGESNLTFHLRIISRSGRDGSRVLTQPGTRDVGPSWSPRGAHVACQSALDPGREDIWVVEVATGEKTRLMADSSRDMHVDWSPRGTHVLYASHEQDSRFDLYVMDARGNGTRQLTTHPSGDFAPAWDKSSVLAVSVWGKQPFTWGWMKALGARAR